jgi:hypothetical protein
MNRPEIIARAVSTLVGLTVSFAITYCGVKWLGDAMDPTRKEKKESQQRVSVSWTRLVVAGPWRLLGTGIQDSFPMHLQLLKLRQPNPKLFNSNPTPTPSPNLLNP